MATDTFTPDPEVDAFICWAAKHAITLSIPRHDDDYDDLGFIKDVIADRSIVAVGESAHYLHEWNRWRTRLFKFLVLHHDFDTFVLESGLVEGRHVHDFVAGADIEWDAVVASITNAWGVWAELNELIRWMREWNLQAGCVRKLKFYCMDGTGNWFHARHALTAVCDYAKRVDAAFAQDIERELGEAVETINFDNRAQVDDARWRLLNGAAALIVSRLQQARLTYIEASSDNDYQWALRSAEILRDVLLDLAQTEENFEIGLRQFWNIRDVSMAESLRWILEREGPDTKIVIGAHNTHLQQHPVRVQRATSMGSYYASRFERDDILFIGAASASSVKGEPPRADCNQWAYDRVGPDCFFLDLRDAPTSGPVSDWLGRERVDRSNLRYQPVCPGAAWDCLIFHKTLSIGEVELPTYLEVAACEVSAAEMEEISGRYIIDGFLAAVNTLDVYAADGKLFTSGLDDTSGELFPPYPVQFSKCVDGKFRWLVWPAVVDFHRDKACRISIDMPGMGIYHGKRVGEPVRAS